MTVAAGRGTVSWPRLSSSPGAGLSISIARPYRDARLDDPQWGSPTTLLRVKWMCESCGFIYDPAEGDPDGGIPPGTPFEDIPETWFCPVCGARKRDFTPYDE